MQLAKRLLDLFAGFTCILILMPVLFFVGLAIIVDSRGPVFFRQVRAGKNGHHFCIYKFRTMVIGAENQGAGVFVEIEDPRITKVGRLLRHTSLDELPQLINIIKGEMSLVGPRPTLPYQVENYDQRQIRRLEVKPGITGWAQVNGRSTLSWPERIELDLWYIDNWSFWLDLKILLKTFKVVIGRSNLYKTVSDDPISGELKRIEPEKDTER